jgi:hypothetical protein
MQTASHLGTSFVARFALDENEKSTDWLGANNGILRKRMPLAK